MRGLLTLLLFALIAAPASGGGWATTSVSSLPDGKRAGEPWSVDVSVLAHGVTPTPGLRPQVTIDGPVRRTFAATPTAEQGVYRARVVFPTAGVWRWRVVPGFGDPLTFPPVRIAAAAPAVAHASPADDAGAPWWRWPLALLAGAGAAAAMTRLARPRPAPARAAVPAP